jgi:hypothetical protein
MLYLAEVSHNKLTQTSQFRLLAKQQNEYTWALISASQSVEAALVATDAGLVLLELSDTSAVLSVQDAKPWILDIVRDYLGCGVTPLDLREEADRAEQWRQTLTLQSQELGRRSLELEARMGQIKALEEQLKHKLQAIEAESST